MLRQVRNVSVLVAFSAGVLLMSGCIQGQDLVGARQLSLEKVEAKGVRVMWAEVRQEGGTAVVTGSLLPRNPAVRRYAGQVVVELVDAAGKVVGTGRSEPVYLIKRGPRKTPGVTRFKVLVNGVAPKGGKVRVGFSHGV